MCNRIEVVGTSNLKRPIVGATARCPSVGVGQQEKGWKRENM